MPTIRVRDIDMHYEVHGRSDAEPLVLLHGFTGTGQKFDPFLEQLGERYQLLVPDLRGHGRTTNPRDEIVHADRDRYFPVRVPLAMYQAIPSAELCIAPNCGHDVPGASPTLFTTALLDFLGRNPF